MKSLRCATSEVGHLPRPVLQRVGVGVAGVWLGVLACLAFMAAPAAFAVLSKDQAGILVGRLFAQEAALSALLALAFIMGLSRLNRVEHGDQGDVVGRAPALSSDGRLWAVLGVLACTVIGYYALQPLMSAARAGQGSLSFASLHGLSAGFFGLKMILLAVLTWRLSC